MPSIFDESTHFLNKILTDTKPDNNKSGAKATITMDSIAANENATNVKNVKNAKNANTNANFDRCAAISLKSLKVRLFLFLFYFQITKEAADQCDECGINFRGDRRGGDNDFPAIKSQLMHICLMRVRGCLKSLLLGRIRKTEA